MNILLMALAPVFALLVYVYRKDVCEKEPKSMLLKAFFSGVGVAIGVILFLTVIAIIFDLTLANYDSVLNAVMTAFLSAAIPEELGKFLALYLLVWKSRHFDEHFDGIVYATYVSLGFAGFENILYVAGNGMGTAIARAFTAVPGHFLFGVIMGYYFSSAKFDDASRRFRNLALAIGIPILWHGVYDALLMSVAAVLNQMGDSKDAQMTETIISFFVAFIALCIGMWKLGKKKLKVMVEKDMVLLEKGERLKNDAAPEGPYDNVNEAYHPSYDAAWCPVSFDRVSPQTKPKITKTAVPLNAVASVDMPEAIAVPLEIAMPEATSEAVCISVPLDAVRSVKNTIC